MIWLELELGMFVQGLIFIGVLLTVGKYVVFWIISMYAARKCK